MTKAELVAMLDAGPVRVKIEGKLMQLTRKPDIAGVQNGGDDIKLTRGAITGMDSGSAIGVYDLGNGKIITITKADVETVIGHGTCSDGTEYPEGA